jgi:hypothetical protein
MNSLGLPGRRGHTFGEAGAFGEGGELPVGAASIWLGSDGLWRISAFLSPESPCLPQ